MRFNPPIPDHTPCESRHDWFNAWLKHSDALKDFTTFIRECFETHPDIPEDVLDKRAKDEALSIIEDVFCGRFKKLKQYPLHHGTNIQQCDNYTNEYNPNQQEDDDE